MADLQSPGVAAQDSAAASRAAAISAAAATFAAVTAEQAEPELYNALTFLLAQVRKTLGMDVVFVSRFVDKARVFQVVSADGEPGAVRPGASDPLLDTYCQKIVDGRLPLVIEDTLALPEAANLPITEALRIRAYLSAPVVLPNGEVFGTVCCISHAVRHDLRVMDAQALRAVADAVAASITHKGVRYVSWVESGR